jgi:hypothetical protein
VKGSTVSVDGETITVHVPFKFRKRGGRKLVVTPDGAEWAPRPRVDNAMVKTLARAFRWRRMLDKGVCATIEELTQRERVTRGYMSRGVLWLTLLAPDIVEAILDGRRAEGMRLGVCWGFQWNGTCSGWLDLQLAHPASVDRGAQCRFDRSIGSPGSVPALR